MPYTPWNERTIGAEIEILAARRDGKNPISAGLRRSLTAKLPPGRVSSSDIRYYHSDGRTWDVKTDSSCGYEIASPALLLTESLQNDELKAACGVLTRSGQQVDRRCGLHIHVNATDLTWQHVQQMVALWSRYEPYFYETFVPAGRRDNHYCQPLRGNNWQNSWHPKWNATRRWLSYTSETDARRMVATDLGRSALNIQGWWQHGRVEFRLHPGTISYDKIRYWAAICAAIVNRVKGDHGMKPVPLAIIQPKPELGFSSQYVFSALGLAPNSRLTASDIPAESRALLRYAIERGKRLAATAASAPTGYVSRLSDAGRAISEEV